MENEMTISRKAKEYKHVCQWCKRPLTEDESNLCLKCEDMRYDAMIEQAEEMTHEVVEYGN